MNFFSNEPEKSRVLSVRELNQTARDLLENALPPLWVGGEISNFVRAASGHWYFSLKDEQAQVRCVMFRQKNLSLDWQPKNGMQIEVRASVTLYEARGDFQLAVEYARPAGLGALYEAFERLKQKLESEGLFAAAKKRALPFMPRQIGVVTSLQAAALRDVLTTLRKRMPSVPVVVYPVPVQGDGAAQKIAQAIETANARVECDVLIVCRGGGSIEDLWAFNEEIVARAIAASAIPVISGVGHETDFTIADFAADARAATPTAAAQLAVPDRAELSLRLEHLERRLQRASQRRFEQAMQQLDFLQRRLVHPAQKMQQQAQQLAALQQRLRRSRPDFAVLSARQSEWRRRLQSAMQRTLESRDLRLSGMRQHLAHLDPEQVLARGYSLVRDEQGAIVTDSATLKTGERLAVRFARGEAGVEVKSVS
ncbi:MAG: exodeoxyribonuclease VII large subunit [Gallionellaceae bacterium]|jgi:exodeoxyribonuclease VII large subunit|nr:exodeoxyribonuclease VII large subunit [Gallionellaceae bacterium]